MTILKYKYILSKFLNAYLNKSRGKYFVILSMIRKLLRQIYL